MEPPDLMEFYSSDLQRETASLSLMGLPSLHVVSQSADPLRAFDVYQHIRVWEDWWHVCCVELAVTAILVVGLLYLIGIC